MLLPPAQTEKHVDEGGEAGPSTAHALPHKMMSSGHDESTTNGHTTAAGQAPASSTTQAAAAAAAAATADATVTAPPKWPTEAWLRSIDAVYDIFEDPELRRKYPRLSMLIWEGVKLCETIVQEVGLEHCALSFNGGKDCERTSAPDASSSQLLNFLLSTIAQPGTVLVHMLAAVVRRIQGHSQPREGVKALPARPPPSTPLLPPIPSLYITCPSPFPTLESFVRASIYRYNLQLHTVRGPMKQALIEYFHGGGVEGVPGLDTEARRKEENGEGDGRAETEDEIGGEATRTRKIGAIFIGTRRTDPNGGSLSARATTDAGWPQVDRIHPILDWSYHDVWDFLRCPELGESYSQATTSNTRDTASASADTPKSSSGVPESAEDGTCSGGRDGVPYCLLYDQGYTSLGSTYNTVPNPILRVSTSSQGSYDTGAPAAVSVGDGTATGLWKPAYMLPDGSLERAGRLKGSKSALQDAPPSAQ
ncbi:3'-phosphoadenosine 5'-phosphosulfate sulfotransferase [Tilletia horrida]|uniref:FAD synthase n=1 Tax=Tilletia horrida TaxID=155126 RepID=A0AAN6GVJ9_9BASI|nr:3'-phosphoadenosine 5'-phosphosulfate sulfotransferase [Tilletia horrida]